MRGLKLVDMSPGLRLRVQQALAAGGGSVARPKAKNAPETCCSLRTGRSKAGSSGPNATEAEYNRLFLAGRGRYEALTLRLPGGSRYTPDWISVDEGRVSVHEVKGAHRFPSEGRALTAWREARAAFPEFAFFWAVRRKDGEWEFRHGSKDLGEKAGGAP